MIDEQFACFCPACGEPAYWDVMLGENTGWVSIACYSSAGPPAGPPTGRSVNRDRMPCLGSFLGPGDKAAWRTITPGQAHAAVDPQQIIADYTAAVVLAMASPDTEQYRLFGR